MKLGSCDQGLGLEGVGLRLTSRLKTFSLQALVRKNHKALHEMFEEAAKRTVFCF